MTYFNNKKAGISSCLIYVIYPVLYTFSYDHYEKLLIEEYEQIVPDESSSETLLRTQFYLIHL
jgi:hypothetical protein